MGQITSEEAKKVARAIQAENPLYITDKVIKAFDVKIEAGRPLRAGR